MASRPPAKDSFWDEQQDSQFDDFGDHHKPSVIAHFAGHMFQGSVIFVLIAVFGVGLSYGVEFLHTLHVSAFTLWVLTFLENTILVVDALLFFMQLVTSVWKAVKELRR
jgi:hypothetical protein